MSNLNTKLDIISKKMTNYHSISLNTQSDHIHQELPYNGPLLRAPTNPSDVFDPLADEEDNGDTPDPDDEINPLVDEPVEDIIIENEKSIDDVTDVALDNITEEESPTDEIVVETISNGVESTIPVTQVVKEINDPTNSLIDLQNDLDGFIEDTRDGMDIGLISNTPPGNVEKTVIMPTSFTTLVLNDDITKLEMYLTNCLNSPNPVAQFMGTIQKKTGGEYATISGGQDTSIQYVMSAFIKYYMNRHLNQKMEIPASIPLVVYKDIKPTADDLSLMYDLYLFMIYYAQVKNQLREKDRNTTNNKELICFLLKSIASPLLFSFLPNVTQNVFISEIIKRYSDYKSNGLFSKMEKTISDRYGINIDIKIPVIKSEIIRTYDILCIHIAKTDIESMFTRCTKHKLINLDYSVFKNNNFTQEQILKIITLDSNFTKNGKIDLKEIDGFSNLKDFCDLPPVIINKFKISNNKFDNTNLIRFANESYKGDIKLTEYLAICDMVGDSYYNLKDKDVDLTQLPDTLLKAIILWDIPSDKKISLNYKYYKERIEKSSLDNTMILSMLNNLENREESNFVDSLTATQEIGV
jgi:hypothetical protein